MKSVNNSCIHTSSFTTAFLIIFLHHNIHIQLLYFRLFLITTSCSCNRYFLRQSFATARPTKMQIFTYFFINQQNKTIVCNYEYIISQDFVKIFRVKRKNYFQIQTRQGLIRGGKCTPLLPLWVLSAGRRAEPIGK